MAPSAPLSASATANRATQGEGCRDALGRYSTARRGPSRPRTERRATLGVLVLPEIALEIINAQPRFASNPYVFAGEGGGHIKSWSRRKRQFDAQLEGVKPWVLHDLRRTARSLMSRAGVRPDISERVLGHVIRGVEGVYDRHAYSEEKAHALKALARLIENITNPPAGNVVSLEARAL